MDEHFSAENENMIRRLEQGDTYNLAAGAKLAPIRDRL